MNKKIGIKILGAGIVAATVFALSFSAYADSEKTKLPDGQSKGSISAPEGAPIGLPPNGMPGGAPGGFPVLDLENALASMVKTGAITQDQADKTITYFTKIAPQGMNSSMFDPLTSLVKDGVLKEEQADTLKASMKPPAMPGGAPGPGGNFGPGGGPRPGGPGSSPLNEVFMGTGLYTLKGEAAIKSDQTVNATKADESAVLVTDGGKLTLKKATIYKSSGDTSSEDNSNFTGLNAAIVAKSGGAIDISDSAVNTDSDGSNAIFSTGEGSKITVTNVSINTTRNSSRGLDATYNGTIIARNVNITTRGAHCGAIATDRGEGNIVVIGATATTSGEGSPGIYSTGNIVVSDSSFKSTGSEAAVIEGKNSITLNNVVLSGAKKWGVMIYQSFSGDASVGTGTFTMTGGSLTASAGPLFFSTNTVAVINLKNTVLKNASGVLLKAGADQWGNKGSNGATVSLNADSQILTGDIMGDDISAIMVALKNNSTLEGAVNSENKLKSMSLTLDSTSKWSVTADSYLTALNDADSTLSNIDDNGFTIYYHARMNDWLNGKTVVLKDGGKLIPKK